MHSEVIRKNANCSKYNNLVVIIHFGVARMDSALLLSANRNCDRLLGVSTGGHE
jgi:hypothetical protein